MHKPPQDEELSRKNFYSVDYQGDVNNSNVIRDSLASSLNNSPVTPIKIKSR